MTQQGTPGRVPVTPDTAVTADGLFRTPDPGPRARTYQIGEYTVVELHGEIDIAGLEIVGPHLDDATATPAPAVIIDLRPTAFFDCSGVGLLCRTHRRVVERGGRMRLVCDNALILRTLRVSRLLEVLRPVATLDEALGEE